MPFVLLILGLLGGGLVCLLVINTTLATASFAISNLQQGNAALSQQEQVLQQQIAKEESPGSIEQRAYRLGMRQQQVLSFLDVRTHRVYTPPLSVVPGTAGYAP